MLKYILFVFLTTLSIYGQSYQTSLLNLHAKVFPKILLSDTQLDEKLVDNNIVIIILYEEKDLKVAQSFQKRILKYHSQLGIYTFDVLLQKYTSFSSSDNATAYYQLLTDATTLQNTNSIIQLKNKISFSYDNSYLDRGTLMSLYIDKKVMPFIDMKTLKNSKIIFKNIIFKIAKTQ